MTAMSSYQLCLGGLVFEWREEGAVTAYADGVDLATLEDTFARSVLPFALHTRGTQVLHASAVLGSSGLCVLCARSGTGKSTIAYALSRRPGALLWADDAVAFDVDAARPNALPLPFSLRLRPASAEHLGRADRPLVRGPLIDRPAAISSVIVLEQLPATAPQDVRVTRLSDDTAFTSVLEHAYCFSFDSRFMKRTSEAYLSLVARVPIYQVRFAGRLELIQRIVDVLEDLNHESSLGRHPR